MRAAGREDGPVAAYEAALTAALHGPGGAKARMIEELCDGLADTVEAHLAEGMPHEQASRLAVREFGTVEEVAPACQRELAIAQTRHTARAAVLAVPFLVTCWLLARTSGLPDTAGQLPRTAQLLAVNLAGVAILAALLTAVASAATGAVARRLPTPHRLPLVVAWAGTTTSVAMAVATLALAVAAALTADWPLFALAGALSAVSHAVVAASARAGRRSARLAVS
ncbi:permease prefix domain 1-containing protein [Streptomyces sp. NPDC057287]|uniref:permease prefix domain 1-containing protein n=1 Tax=Streptomyces sp. NPDC057287 TaxID=3346086 RepID=UPI003642EA2B